MDNPSETLISHPLGSIALPAIGGRRPFPTIAAVEVLGSAQRPGGKLITVGIGSVICDGRVGNAPGDGLAVVVVVVGAVVVVVGAVVVGAVVVGAVVVGTSPSPRE
ncbi:hypothetical protein, partial [Mycobacterium kansasii]|uniref:hypothetical protein n=1 Tax=Mycobacterium kansasii TaxID=1768 RepID=UPI001913D0E0